MKTVKRVTTTKQQDDCTSHEAVQPAPRSDIRVRAEVRLCEMGQGEAPGEPVQEGVWRREGCGAPVLPAPPPPSPGGERAQSPPAPVALCPPQVEDNHVQNEGATHPTRETFDLWSQEGTVTAEGALHVT